MFAGETCCLVFADFVVVDFNACFVCVLRLV